MRGNSSFMNKLNTAKPNSGKGSGTKGSFEGEPIDVSTLNIPAQIKVKKSYEDGFGDIKNSSRTPTIPKRYSTRTDPLGVKHNIEDIS